MFDDVILTIIIIILAVFPLLWQDLAKLDTILILLIFVSRLGKVSQSLANLDKLLDKSNYEFFAKMSKSKVSILVETYIIYVC